jgi:outer membrane receptor protein involved in Fe transport
MLIEGFKGTAAMSKGALNTVFTAFIAVGLADAALVIVSEAVARADAFTTGALRGVVKDKVGGEIVGGEIVGGEIAVGATVVATSPALQGEQIAITDETGGYYLTALPPGIYTLTVYYSDVKYSRSEVLVQVGKEAVVNLTIDSAAGKGEVIPIIGTPPIVDQGSTKIGQTITPEYTNNIPTASTFGGVMAAAGGAQKDAFGISFAGATSAENTYIVEGLNTTDTGFGILSSDLPNEFIQETEVITGGYNAEYGRATGAIVNVVTKSGSNEFHGSVFGHYQPGVLTAAADTILREGTAIDRVTNQDYRYDLGAELGGPIVKDKLWFHLGFTPTFTKTTTTRIISHNIDDDDDGIPDSDPETGFTRREQVARRDIPSNVQTYFFTGKLTGAISANHQWQITGWGNPQRADAVFGTVRDPSSTRARTDQGAYDLSAKWTSKFGDGKTQVDAVIGYHNGYNKTQPLHAADDVPAVVYAYTRSLYDFADLEGSGIEACNDGPNDRYKKIVNCPVLNYIDRGLGFLQDRTNNRTSALLAVTQRVKAAGQHIFKVGIDAELSTYDSGRGYSGGAVIFRNHADDLSNPAMPVLGTYSISQFLKYDKTGSVPCGIDADGDGVGDARCAVIPRLDADTNDRSLSAYLQDSWQIRPNLTLNAGLRWEQQTGYVAKFLQGTVSPDTGETIPKVGFQLDNLLAPRLGFIYDPTQDGKAKIMGHWGRFYENVPMDVNVRSFGGETLLASTVGIGRDGVPDNSCPFDHRDGRDLTTKVLGCTPGSTQALGGGIAYVAPGLKGQYTQELIAGAEYEALPGMTIGASYVHRTLPSVIEDMSTDGGSHYLIGNPSANYDDEARKLEAQASALMNGSDADKALAALYQSRASQLRAVKFFDPPSRNYDALQVTAKTRATRNSLLTATYTYSRARGNYPGLFSTETNQLDPNITSQYDLPDLMPNRYGPSGLDRPHNLKVDGFYQLDFQKAGLVIVGASVRAQSGIPSNTLAAHPIYGPGESYLLPRGTVYRSPASMTVDTHISYGYQLSKTTRLEGYVEIFNLFDQQPEISVDETYTTNSSLPIVGGDTGDLPHAKATLNGRQTPNIVTKNLNYGKTTARQAPLTGQLGFRLTF